MLESNLYPTMHDTIERVMFDIQTRRVQDPSGIKGDIRNIIEEIGKEYTALVNYRMAGNHDEVRKTIRRIAAITVGKMQDHLHIGQTFSHGQVLPVFKNEDHG